MYSKVDYFEIKKGDEVFVQDIVKAHKDDRKDGLGANQKLDIYKCTTANTNKIHYLYAMEIA